MQQSDLCWITPPPSGRMEGWSDFHRMLTYWFGWKCQRQSRKRREVRGLLPPLQWGRCDYRRQWWRKHTLELWPVVPEALCRPAAGLPWYLSDLECMEHVERRTRKCFFSFSFISLFLFLSFLFKLCSTNTIHFVLVIFQEADNKENAWQWRTLIYMNVLLG